MFSKTDNLCLTIDRKKDDGAVFKQALNFYKTMKANPDRLLHNFTVKYTDDTGEEDGNDAGAISKEFLNKALRV